MNSPALRLLRSISPTKEDRFALEDLFDDSEEFNLFNKDLRRAEAPLERMIQKLGNDGIMRTFSLLAVLAAEQLGEPATVNCVISDVTDQVRRERERETLIEKLRVSLLFLQEPVGQLGASPYHAIWTRLSTKPHPSWLNATQHPLWSKMMPVKGPDF